MYEFNIFSILSILLGITYVFLGIYTFMLNPKNSSNRLFLLMCVSMSLWGWVEGMFRAATTENVGMPWGVYFMALGSSVHTLAIVFFWLNFSENWDKIKHKILLSVTLISPFAVFLIIRYFFTSLMITGISKEYWGYSLQTTNLYILYELFVVTYTAAIIFLAIRKYYTSKEIYRQKYLNFAIGVSIPVIVGTVTQVLAPVYNIHLPELTVTSAFGFIIIVAYTIKKYDLLAVSIEVVANNIIDAINESVIAVNKKLKIDFTNKALLAISGYETKELVGASIDKVINDELTKLPYDKVIRRLPMDNYKTQLILKDGTYLNVLANISVINNNNNNNNGFVVVLRDTKNIDNLINNLNQKNTEFEKINTLMAGREIKMSELQKQLEILKQKANK